MTTPLIATEGLCRSYGRKQALEPLNLRIPPGRVVALLGPNGAGKTTLLRLLLGLLEPTAGRATVLGCDVRQMPAGAASRVASMIEGHEPPGWARLGWMVGLQRAASRQFDARTAGQLLSEKGLGLRRRYGRLSKGQRRWTLASLMLASGADVLLLDEPADGLDPAARRSLYNHLRGQVNDRDSAALVATHIIDDIERVADDVAVLHRGRLLLHEDLEQLRDEVRQVDLPASAPCPDDLGEVLATQRLGDRRMAWLRCGDGAEQRLVRQCGHGVRLRPFELEPFYLALTSDQGSAEKDSAAETTEEVTRCV